MIRVILLYLIVAEFIFNNAMVRNFGSDVKFSNLSRQVRVQLSNDTG